jgi:glutaredoxin-related protein
MGWSLLVSAKIMCHVQNAGQIHDMRMANKSFDSVAKLKYLGITLKNHCCVHEEMKKRFEFSKAC